MTSAVLQLLRNVRPHFQPHHWSVFACRVRVRCASEAHTNHSPSITTQYNIHRAAEMHRNGSGYTLLKHDRVCVCACVCACVCVVCVGTERWLTGRARRRRRWADGCRFPASFQPLGHCPLTLTLTAHQGSAFKLSGRSLLFFKCGSPLKPSDLRPEEAKGWMNLEN